MTESIENELTPEEKLLQVIRDGDDASEPETISVESTEIAEEKKQELKLVEKDEESKAHVDAEVAAATVVPDATVADGDTDSAIVVKSGRSSLVSIGFINKILAIVVIVMIGLAIYEIWKNIKYSAYKTDNTGNVLVAGLVDQAPEDELPPLGDVLKKFADSEFIGEPDNTEAVETVEVTKSTPIEAYAKKNLNLIGLSDDEAIVSDGKTGKMHFLKLGDKMKINDVDVKVSSISSEYVELSDGDKKIRIE